MPPPELRPAASAESVPAGDGKGPPPRTRTALVESLNARHARLDANADGSITADELQKAEAARAAAVKAQLDKKAEENFARLDTDRDGKLSLGEYKVSAPSVSVDEEKLTQLQSVLDADKDGKITREEFGRPTLAFFDKLDADKNGTVTAEERRRAAAPAGR